MSDRTYQAKIVRNVFGFYSAAVYVVDGDERELIGDTSSGLGGWTPYRDSAISRAKRIARRHRDGPDIVELDLDAPEAALAERQAEQ